MIAAAGLAEPSIGPHSGFVAVVDGQGRKLAVTPVDGQVMDLAAADFDGDGSDELVAVSGAYRLLVLRLSGAMLLEETIASPSGTKLAVVPGPSGPRLVVGDGANLQVRRMRARRRARMVRGAGPIGAAVGGLLLLALAAAGERFAIPLRSRRTETKRGPAGSGPLGTCREASARASGPRARRRPPARSSSPR